jgi:histidinol dehydrogenase
MKIIKKSEKRNNEDNNKLASDIKEIIDNIIENEDEALLKYNEKFDGCIRENIRLSREEIDEAYSMVSKAEISDLREAAYNIREFAKAQRDTVKPIEAFSPREGITLGHRIIPIDSCCCYVPGGNYPLYSTALMLAIPAKVAGVKRITACSPAVKGTNKINSKTVVAMDIGGVDEIYAVGGAHAIAAFSYGTKQIKPVDIIVGPGNRYVTEAKRQCFGQIGIDFLAGPSEVLIIADKDANPEILAADILAQSEHDVNAKGILVTDSMDIADKTIKAVSKQLEELSTSKIAREAWNSYGEVIFVDDLKEAVEISNEYAPEHLEINVSNPDDIVENLRNYGSLFIGENTAEVFGDYASGTNHTLPTLRASRYTGGVWVGTFLKTCTFQYMTKAATKAIAPLVSRLASGEGLEGHAKAADIRIKNV